MTTPFVTGDVGLDEGLRLRAYPDPLSPLAKAMALPAHMRPAGWQRLSGEPWTCGYGCTGPDVRQGTVWTPDLAAERRDQKIREAEADLDRNAPWWHALNDARQDVLVNMAYNMGWPKLSGFKRMIAAAAAGDFNAAAHEMLDSKWAPQVGARAARLAQQMKSGVRVPRRL